MTYVSKNIYAPRDPALPYGGIQKEVQRVIATYYTLGNFTADDVFDLSNGLTRTQVGGAVNKLVQDKMGVERVGPSLFRVTSAKKLTPTAKKSPKKTTKKTAPVTSPIDAEVVVKPHVRTRPHYKGRNTADVLTVLHRISPTTMIVLNGKSAVYLATLEKIGVGK